MTSSWGYTKGDGPETWLEKFPAARGPRQSPIDISTSNCVNAEHLSQRPLRIAFGPNAVRSVVNTGYGFKVNVDGEGSELAGGPLQNKYRVDQFHFHWGRDDTCGSEHTIDGQCYPSEVHLVHWNSEKYASIGEAVTKDDGLAVLGALIKVGKEHQELAKLIDLLPSIKYKSDQVSFTDAFDLMSLLPGNKEYWTYEGSLTTPPCNESVTWFVFKEPIEMSSDQLRAFRELCSYCQCDDCPDDEFEGKILLNFRPPLSVGERVVSECTF